MSSFQKRNGGVELSQMQGEGQMGGERVGETTVGICCMREE